MKTRDIWINTMGIVYLYGVTVWVDVRYPAHSLSGTKQKSGYD